MLAAVIPGVESPEWHSGWLGPAVKRVAAHRLSSLDHVPYLSLRSEG